MILILYCTVCWNTWLINSSIKPFWLCGLSNWLVCITFVVQTLMWKIQNSIYCNLQSLLRNHEHDTIQVLVSLNDDFQNYLHININTYIYVCALDTMGDHCNIPTKGLIRIFQCSYFISTNNCWVSNKCCPLKSAALSKLRSE